MIRTVRPLLTGRRGRLAGVLLVLTLVAGVVVMHAMSGSATRHAGHHAPVAFASTVASTGHASSGTTTGTTAHAAFPAVEDTGGTAGCSAGGCGGHEMVTAMCLMILAVLLTFVGPGSRALLRVEGPQVAAWFPLPAASRRPSGPSLHALGISRT
ncbi:hypothetical protein [Krasilnikoviella flava]|uniref:Uncharacterized protein n=1 Tax=Krasilnikoviella flava TaxID=526729 RepID=A0A1T5KAW2_9MICO|nr:hypothetical protein [Krasilnikoviella flava]SKC60843.1 hypothetical protein SAMN04324258_2011 [Krasilnikoviella flava]